MNAGRPEAEVLLRVTGLAVRYGARTAIEAVTFSIAAGETVGLVGESGSGKSTLARAILRLVPAAAGGVAWRGRDLLGCRGTQLRRVRRDLQMIFQDPLASLNPRMTVGDAVAEPIGVFEPGLGAAARRARTADMLERVGLSGELMGRFPHEFSGGQCQRIGIARAMILNPALLICDEPVSSLDVSVQGQVVNLLLELQNATGMAMLFISHNLAVVRHVSHRIVVMYAGRIVEDSASEQLFARAAHPYTRDLLAAVPVIRAAAAPRAAPPATAAADAPGCSYRSRCVHAQSRCELLTPLLEEVAPGRFAACHRARELLFSAS